MMLSMAGMIGTGKTVYTARLTEELGIRPFYELVEENPLLEKYYNDRATWGFTLQIYLLNMRFAMIKEAGRCEGSIMDRCIYEDELFTYVNMKDGIIRPEEFDVYVDLRDNIMEEIEGLPKKAPDLLIYLDGSLDYVLTNIKKRGREFEQGQELVDYYTKLHEQYAIWFEAYDVGPKMVINAEDYDVHRDEDWAEVYELIREELQERGLIDENCKQA